MGSKSDSRYQPIPTPLESRVERTLTPFQDFVRDQAITGSVLLLCTVAALVIANSPLAPGYEALLHRQFGLVFGDHGFRMSVRHWINEGLMALFFFLLGLEIKRELLVGELRDAGRAMPVIAAALGGMLVPAGIFSVLNAGTPHAAGWGIPMATDTAFALGILALLGSRIPPAAMTFLTALAIMDDLGAILVIAVFYTGSIDLASLAFAAACLGVLVVLNLLGIRRPGIYLLGGVLVWAGMLGSGVHATVAGVLVAAVVPARPKRAQNWFLQRARRLMERFREIADDPRIARPILAAEEQHAVVEQLQDAAEKATTPLQRWERALENPVGFAVMPIFALANAGIPVSLAMLEQLWSNPLSAGILLGLVVGKGLGIPLFAWLALRLNLGRLPDALGMRHIVGIGLLGGMGFTMSIFIAGLGFEEAPAALLAAKSAILLASLLAGIGGYLWLRLRG